MVLAEAVVWAPVTERVQVLRGGRARAYVIAEEHDDGSLLLAPEPVPGAQETVPAENGRAAAVAVPELAGILQVRDLTVTYGPKRAVDTVSFEIRRGEIFGLLGPNGAGKTSTLSAIEGLVKPQSGTILLDDIDSRRHPNQARARMGVQLQATSFQSELKISEIVRLYAGLYGVELSGQQILDGLRVIGLEGEAHKPFKQLSGGQQQRLSLLHRGRPRPRVTAARRAHRRPRSAIPPPAVEPDRAHPPGGRKHPFDHALDGGGPGGLRSGRDHR